MQPGKDQPIRKRRIAAKSDKTLRERAEKFNYTDY